MTLSTLRNHGMLVKERQKKGIMGHEGFYGTCVKVLLLPQLSSQISHLLQISPASFMYASYVQVVEKLNT